MEKVSKRKQTFVNYVLDKLKSRLDATVAPSNYKQCAYTYETNSAEENLRNDQQHKDGETTSGIIPINKKKKKTPAKDSGRLYQASLPIEGLEVTRQDSASCTSDSTDSNEFKKRKRKRKRRRRTKKIIDEDNRTCTGENVVVPTEMKVPMIAQPGTEGEVEHKLSKKLLRKEAKIASIRAGLKNEAHSLAKVWNNFFEARFTLVTETENVEDILPESCNRILINTGCNDDNYDTLKENELLSADDLGSKSNISPSSFDMQHEKSRILATSFEERYEELEKSEGSEEDGSTNDNKSKQSKPNGKDNTVKLSKNQKRRRKKKRRQFYLRKEEAERKATAKKKEEEQSAENFAKLKEEVVAFFDSLWDIFLQEKKESLNHVDLEGLRLKLLHFFEHLQNLEQGNSCMFDMLVSIKKWLLLLDNNRAKAVLENYQLSDALQDHKMVIKCLVEYWITDIAPSLDVNSAS
ncbi:uncharacterized protein LOC117108839 [Anneissia japonica]|uniref:uncharacterized protein LOC117108839 n=1 Tax=Anneissia japonica TaxID=1529436 RepID=UPI00142596FD|nr:uncharacterized protein LOC117108839 [Anneissia japonica]